MVNNNHPVDLPKAYTVSYFDENEWNKDLTQDDLKQQEIINASYEEEIKSQKQDYGPCSYSDCPYSSPFEIEIYIEGISRKWVRRPNYGTFLHGSWEWSPTNSYLYRTDLWLTDIDQARRVTSLIVDDDVWTTNLWGGHCVEDSKLCNNALKIIRASINHHENGYGIKVRETLDSDISKWSEWGLKVGVAVGTSFVNPVAGIGIGVGALGVGKAGQEICDSDRGKAFWGTVSGLGEDTLKGAALGIGLQSVGAVAGFNKFANLGSNCEGAFNSAVHGWKVVGDIEFWTSRGFEGWQATKHIAHKNDGIQYQVGCKICEN